MMKNTKKLLTFTSLVFVLTLTSCFSEDKKSISTTFDNSNFKSDSSSYKSNYELMSTSNKTSYRESGDAQISNDIVSLPIPPIIEDLEEFTLIPQNGVTEFFDGVETETRGYNGSLLGPTLRLTKGESYDVTIQNEMDEETTVHWHGLLVDSDVDGVFQVVDEGKSYDLTLDIDQEASTAWYHPHTMHKTASQVMDGLAGFIIIEDEVSEGLKLPADYGVNDIPIVFQRKAFNNSGQIKQYGNRNVYLTNGVINPTLEVKNEWVRTRIINGNNDELFELSFSNSVPSYIIATDNGFIEEPILQDKILLAPGERVELLLDLTSYEVGDTIKVFNDDVNTLDIVINEEVSDNYSFELPEQLVEFEEEDINLNDLNRRDFDLYMKHHNPYINGKRYREKRIDEYIELGTKEIWTITNYNSMMARPHPFHVHGVTFKILNRDGAEVEDWEKGYKDTVLLLPGETVELLVSFDNVGKFVYHCHFLDHEEDGMMGNFIVQ